MVCTVGVAFSVPKDSPCRDERMAGLDLFSWAVLNQFVTSMVVFHTCHTFKKFNMSAGSIAMRRDLNVTAASIQFIAIFTVESILMTFGLVFIALNVANGCIEDELPFTLLPPLVFVMSLLYVVVHSSMMSRIVVLHEDDRLMRP
jgi:hypothetical protein